MGVTVTSGLQNTCINRVELPSIVGQGQRKKRDYRRGQTDIKVVGSRAEEAFFESRDKKDV